MRQPTCVVYAWRDRHGQPRWASYSADVRCFTNLFNQQARAATGIQKTGVAEIDRRLWHVRLGARSRGTTDPHADCCHETPHRTSTVGRGLESLLVCEAAITHLRIHGADKISRPTK